MERIDLAAALAGAGSIAWVTKRLAEERNRRHDAETRVRSLEYAAMLAEARALAAPPPPRVDGGPDLRNASTGYRRPGIGRREPAIARTFDYLFAVHGHGLPVTFLRALAYGESRLNPRSDNGHAAGLLQIEHVVRLDHNRRHGTAYTRSDLFDPSINIVIGAAALRTIIESYARRHGATFRNLTEDWDNYRFVELLAQGWNAGWSDRAGVGRVAHHLASLGSTNITVELVHEHAAAAGATRHLREPRRVAWAKSVARHYTQERAREYSDAVATGAVADRIDAAHAAAAGAAAAPPGHQPDVIEMPPMIIERPPIGTETVIEMPPMIIDRPAATASIAADAYPVSMPSQVDRPSPSPLLDPYAPSPSPLLDPYAPGAPVS